MKKSSVLRIGGVMLGVIVAVSRKIDRVQIYVKK